MKKIAIIIALMLSVMATVACGGRGNPTASTSIKATSNTSQVTVENSSDDVSKTQVLTTNKTSQESVSSSSISNIVTSNATSTPTNPKTSIVTSVSSSVVISVSSNSSIVVEKNYNVSIGSVTNGTIQVDKTSATIGDVVTFSCTPASGYKLSYYTVNGAQINGNTYTMQTANITVSAVFEKIVYTITKGTASNGTIQVDKTSATIGDVVTFSCTPASGYKLSYYTVNGTQINGNTYTMQTANITVSAVFEKIEYSITITQSEGGTVTASANKATMGTTITLYVTCNEHYSLVTYKVNGSAISGNTFTMPTGNVTITVEYSYEAHWTEPV